MTSHDPYDWVNNSTRVRVRTGATGSDAVMAYSQSPQILVVADDGTRSWWPVTLPIEVMEEKQ